MTDFSKTEALRRLRVLAAEARRNLGLPRNAPAEVGERLIPLVIEDIEEPYTVFVDGDDLDDFVSLPGAARGHARQQGAVVHLYIYSAGPWRELEDVVVGWMGTHRDAPVLIG